MNQRERAEQHQEIQEWSARALTLRAGNSAVTTAKLLEFAERAAALYPDGVVTIEEFALRVIEQDGKGPRLHWQD